MARKPRKLAAADLQDRALDYLGRYAASTRRLRQVLTRRIRRSAEAHEMDPAPLLAELEQVIARLTRSGLLNDTAFAEMKARSLNRRGGSRRRIAAGLAASGVAATERAKAIERLEEETPDAELAAALAYAGRRRLGAFRAKPDDSPERRRKDLAAMARAGFALDIARRALEGDEDDG
ncbi:MAG TPA: RecX family transcriptional regulator [Dongiaceae bacterium]|jgi:regulatory protein|nr:RecX family transcriptional regulator [Dongiaceae bacterium]